MAAYATYWDYINDYGGTIVVEKRFPALAARASAEIDCITSGRAALHRQDSAVKLACCAVTESLYANAQPRAGITAESIGDQSVSYDLAAVRSACLEAATPYLMPLGILYSGVRL